MVMVLSTVIAPATYAQEQSKTTSELYQEIHDLLKFYHISNPTDEQLNKETIDEMIASVNDPYTYYLTPERLSFFMNFLNGEAGNVGIQFTKKENQFIITGTQKDSSAEKAGLKKGDIIVKIGDYEITSEDAPETVYYKLIGPKDSKIKVTIKRDGNLQEVSLVREAMIKEPLVSKMLDNKIGYLGLKVFGIDLALQFSQELKKLKKQGLKGLILDLRGNPGGEVNAAKELISNFVKQGTYMHTKDATQKVKVQTVYRGIAWDRKIPIILLVDEGSASASEIVTGALKDYGLVTIIGQKTYGKGVAQQIFLLSDGGALSVTFLEYFTPLMKKVNGIGFTPDLNVKQIPNSTYDAQLETAIELLNKKGVFMVSKGKVVDLGSSVINKDGKAYLAVRDFSSKVGGKVFYETKEKKLYFQLGDERLVENLKNSSKIVIKGHKSYIEVDYLREKFKTLQLFNK